MAAKLGIGRGRGIGSLAVRRLRAFGAWLLRPGYPVLPLYQVQRSTIAILARRLALFVTLALTSFVYGILVIILPPQLLMFAAVPLVVLALLVIWVLPASARIPTGLMRRIFLIYFVILLLWPNYVSFSFGGLPWISLRRLFGTILLLLLLVCASSSKRFRQEIGRVFASSPVAARLLIGFLIVQFLATVTSTAPAETIGRFINAVITVDLLLFVTMWIIGTGVRTPEWWVNVLLACASILMVIGVAEFRQQHILWANHIPSFLRVDDAIVQVLLRPGFRAAYRVVTTFSTPLAYGEFIALVAPLVLYKLANARGPRWLLFWGMFDLAVVISGYLSGARLSMVGIIVGHVVMLLFWGIWRWRTDRGGLLGIATTMMFPAIALVIALMVMFVPAVHNRVLGGGATQVSNDARHQQLALAIPAVARRPLFGYGPGEGGGAIGWRSPSGFLSVDSGYLSTGADYGVLGLVGFFGTIFALGIALLRSGYDDRSGRFPLQFGFTGLLCVYLTTRLVLSQIDNDALIFTVFGVCFAILYRAQQQGVGRSPRARSPAA